MFEALAFGAATLFVVWLIAVLADWVGSRFD